MAEHDDDTTHLVCQRVNLPRPGPVIPGAQTERCAGCGEAVWVSPSSYTLLSDWTRSGAAYVISCSVCALTDAVEEVAAPTEAQVAELHRAGLDDATIAAVLDAVRARHQEHPR